MSFSKMLTSLAQQSENIGLSVPLFSSPQELSEALTFFKKECPSPNRTFSGLYRFLNISEKKYNELKKSEEYGHLILQNEYSIRDEWENKLVGANTSGVIKFLQANFREQYGNDAGLSGDMPMPIIKVINLTVTQNINTTK